MTHSADLLGALAFRSHSLRILSERRAIAPGLAVFVVGFLAYVAVRNAVYASLRLPGAFPGRNPLAELFDIHLLQTLVFACVVYVPVIIGLSNWFAGDGLGWSVSREEYKRHLSALSPLWGLLFLVAAPVQWLVPHVVVLGPVGIGVGLTVLVLLLSVYTVWGIRELSFISGPASVAVFVLSLVTLPLFYAATMFLFALPLIILLPLAYLAIRRFRLSFSTRVSEREFRRRLHALALNPQDADAQYQLGLISLNRGNLAAAERYLGKALEIDSSVPDYHYMLGRVREKRGDWTRALQHYEETYRLDSGYGQGDIFREVGKGYLHTDNVQKAAEFLSFFLGQRSTDPEGRYWLAITLQKRGDPSGMRAQLHTLLDQARSNPRFFRKENREWIHRARSLLRSRP